MSLILAKFGTSGTTTQVRSILLRRQSNTVYDIQKVRWTWFTSALAEANDGLMGALSVRAEDQVEDAGTVSFDDMVQNESLFVPFSGFHDLTVEGAGGIVGNYESDFAPDPFTVPFAAVVMNFAVAGNARLGVEVYFRRVRVSNIRMAEVVAQTGGLDRTS